MLLTERLRLCRCCFFLFIMCLLSDGRSKSERIVKEKMSVQLSSLELKSSFFFVQKGLLYVYFITTCKAF